MSVSSRMQFPFPDSAKDPWFDDLTSFRDAVDISSFASREDRSIVVTGGGLFTFSSISGIVTWASIINILSPISGFLISISANNISLADGEVCYVNLTRYPVNNLTVTMQKASLIPSTDNAFIIAYRKNNILFFRNGVAINSGGSVAPFSSSGFGTVGQKLRQIITITSMRTDSTGVFTRAGNIYFNPLDYVIAGTTMTVKYCSIGTVASGGTGGGKTKLRNVTDAVDVVQLTHSSGDTTPTKLISSNLTLPSSEKIYEVQIADNSAPLNTFNMQWAGLQIDLTF